MVDQHWIDIVKEKHPDLFEPILTAENIEVMTRDQVINEICKSHPGAGVEKGYSWYIGGMADTGEWLPEKMKVIAIRHLDELKQFLLQLQQGKKRGNQWNIQNLAEYYKIDSLPEPERTIAFDKRRREFQEKERKAMSDIVKNIENKLMWGK